MGNPRNSGVPGLGGRDPDKIGCEEGVGLAGDCFFFPVSYFLLSPNCPISANNELRKNAPRRSAVVPTRWAIMVIGASTLAFVDGYLPGGWSREVLGGCVGWRGMSVNQFHWIAELAGMV